MELRTDVPAFIRNLDNLNKMGSGIDACTLHSRLFEFVLISIVEFVAVPMSLLNDCRFPLRFIRATSFGKFTFVSSKSHGAA